MGQGVPDARGKREGGAAGKVEVGVFWPVKIRVPSLKLYFAFTRPKGVGEKGCLSNAVLLLSGMGQWQLWQHIRRGPLWLGKMMPKICFMWG